MTIFVDMDGVIADFFKELATRFGAPVAMSVPM